MFKELPKPILDDLRSCYIAFQNAEAEVQRRWTYIALLGHLPEGAVLTEIQEKGVIYSAPPSDTAVDG